MNRNEDGSFRRGLKRSNSKEAWIAPCAASPLAYVYASIPVPHSISICAVHVWGPPPITCELLISRAGKIRGKTLTDSSLYILTCGPQLLLLCYIPRIYIYIYNKRVLNNNWKLAVAFRNKKKLNSYIIPIAGLHFNVNPPLKKKIFHRLQEKHLMSFEPRDFGGGLAKTLGLGIDRTIHQVV